jgi:hypothetical protein
MDQQLPITYKDMKKRLEKLHDEKLDSFLNTSEI